MSTLWVGEAPGRLDVLGGVADYSGSLVLEMPISGTTRVTMEPQSPPALFLASTNEQAVSLPLVWLQEVVHSEVAHWRSAFDRNEVPQWARYVVGCFLLFCKTNSWWPATGLNLRVESTVPTSMGVSSSAALEVATLRALEAASGHRFHGTELAKLAQRAENEIVGAPCGLMDQLASAYGVQGAVLPILCRPDILAAPVPLPEGVVVVGWPSGVKHAVADAPYATARTAAFMGKKILEQHLGTQLNHITELSPSQVQSVGEDLLPISLHGEEFIARFNGVDDPLSTIEPQRVYPVRAGASFPVGENFRSQLAVQLLHSAASASSKAEALTCVGELMYQSHAGYTSIGLGCPETDVIVEAVRACGPEQGFYGARVSGGGSGGTVVVLLETSALPSLETMAATITGGNLPLIR